jgi:hypothetical protein
MPKLKLLVAALWTVTAATVAFQGCGSSKDNEDDDTSTQSKYDFTKDVNPILTTSCGTSGCHGTTAPGSTVYVGNETNFKNSKVESKRRMGLAATDTANVMPRAPSTITTANKEILIKFLDQ